MRLFFALLWGLGDAQLGQSANVIWVSQPLATYTAAVNMSAHCKNDESTAVVLLCTAAINAVEYFGNRDLFTKGQDGLWNTTNPLARGGAALTNTLFGNGAMSGVIRDFLGNLVTSDVTHSCNATGYFVPGTACGGIYGSMAGNAITGPAGDLRPAWRNGTLVACTVPIRFYCVAYISSVTKNPTAAPTDAPTTATPTTAAPTTATPTTAAPTPFPTNAPTLLPTAFPTTAAPQAGPPTTALPTTAFPTTSFPTTTFPTTSRPTTAFPTTPRPTTAFPTTPRPTTTFPTAGPTTEGATLAPTALPTLAPSVAPTTAITSAPSQAPTCSGCSITITPGNSSNVTVGPPGGPPVIITIPPTAIPNCSNCSVVIILTPTPSGPSGGGGVVTIEVVDNGVPRSNVTLEQPFTFFMPYSADLVGCTGPVNANCVWRDGTVWENSGCSSQNVGTGTMCTCTNFTDFAVLLDESAPHPCQSRPSSIDVLYVFIAFYAMLFVYCVLTVSRLCYTGAKQGRGVMLLQHSLIGAVCVLRILSCLNYLRTFGDAMGLSAFVAAAPYPLEYLLFTKFASTWAGLVHFSMLNTEARWKKIRPLFYSINVIGTCLAVGLFVMFYVESSFESALAGTVVLALLYLALAITFAVYATKLVKELAKVSSGSSASKGPSRRRCGVEAKIQLTGHLAAVCFVVQALCSVLALALPSEQLVAWTATFCFFNVVALLCILVVYSAAVLRASKATLTPTHTDASYTSRQADAHTSTGEMQVLK